MAGAGTITPAFAQPANPAIEGESEINPHFINSGPGFGNRLALTFDDGPTPGITERVLTELSKRNLKRISQKKLCN